MIPHLNRIFSKMLVSRKYLQQAPVATSSPPFESHHTISHLPLPLFPTELSLAESSDPALLLRRYERQIKELKQELAMRDALRCVRGGIEGVTSMLVLPSKLVQLVESAHGPWHDGGRLSLVILSREKGCLKWNFLLEVSVEDTSLL